MAADASELLGAPQVAGVYVMPRGQTMARAWRQGARVAGGVVGAGGGELAAGAAAKQGAAVSAQTPLKGKALLAVTDADVALLKLKSGGMTSQAGEVIAQVPRDQVTGATLADGMVPKLSISFADGAMWSLDVPRVFLKQRDTKRIVELLGG